MRAGYQTAKKVRDELFSVLPRGTYHSTHYPLSHSVKYKEILDKIKSGKPHVDLIKKLKYNGNKCKTEEARLLLSLARKITIRKLHGELKKIENRFGGVCFDSRVNELSFNNKNVVISTIIYSKEVEVYFGDFRVTIILYDGATRIQGIGDNFHSDGSGHPVSASNGYLCLGEGIAAFRKFMTIGNLFDAAMIIDTVLRTDPGGGGYRNIEEWLCEYCKKQDKLKISNCCGVKSCKNCYKNCNECEIIICKDCECPYHDYEEEDLEW